MTRNEIIKYWIANSDNDYRAMSHLFEKGDYVWALFIGHLVIEKLIKAWYVYRVDQMPPFIHDLVRLAEKAKLPISESQKDILDTISTFNIKSRYDDYRMSFYQKCSNAFATQWVAEIEEFRQWIKEKLQRQL